MDLSDITPTQERVRKTQPVARNILGLGSYFFEGCFGYIDEPYYVTEYKVNVEEIKKGIHDYIKEMTLDAFDCAAQIVADYQLEMQRYSSSVASTVDRSIKDKNRNSEVVEKEITEIGVSKQWFEEKLVLINSFQTAIKGESYA